MVKYFSTFITGFGEVIVQDLKSSISDVEVELLLDGLIVYKTETTFGQIRQLRFFNNSFGLLESVQESSSDTAMKVLIDRVIRRKFVVPVERRTSFRIMFSRENQPVAVDPQTLRVLEKKFVSSDLSVNRTNPGVELLFLTRKDGYGFFGLRLTRHTDYKKILHPGELRPELANLLCFLSEPKPEDVFLDPFAGYGAIPVEWANAFPYSRIYAGDIDPKLESAKFGKRFIVGKWDAANLAEFKDESVDKVVTDPPWGIYENNENIEQLYFDFFKEAHRILRMGGILIVLTARQINTDLFSLQKTYNILVSGKKATVYKFVRSIT